jgi:hypothetical protein
MEKEIKKKNKHYKLCTKKIKFVLPPSERTKNRRYSDHTNEAVNMLNVASIGCFRTSYYPDNEGIPIITFTYTSGLETDWYFDKGQEKLVKKTFNKLTRER